MNKKSTVEAIYEKVGFSKRETTAIVDATLELIKSALAADESVMISSFGKFSVRERKALKRRNPQTGQTVIIPARKVVTFKASRVLRERINEAHRGRDT
jgi:integration host factor subunit alpha